VEIQHKVKVGLVDTGEIPKIRLLTKRVLKVSVVPVLDFRPSDVNDSVFSGMKKPEELHAMRTIHKNIIA
jgi:hypothetical protein